MEVVVNMTELQMWSLLVGSGLPPLIAILQQPRWSTPVKAVVTLLVCLLVGTVNVVLNDVALDFGNWRAILTSILILLVAAYSTYQSFWKPTGIAPAIERGTSPAQNNH